MVETVTPPRAKAERAPISAPLRDRCIHELFEAQAVRTPHATALLFEGRRLTYRQLDLQAARFALRLQALGVRPGSFVALYAPRSLETIISLLGILKAGAAYVALDMESPADRLALMLSDVEPLVIITLHPLAHDLPPTGATLLFLNEEFDLRDDSPVPSTPGIQRDPVTATDLACVAFTSGSGGVPKGVCITHRGVVRLAKSNDFISIRPEDVFLQFAPLSFDASTFEIWNCLLNGAKLAIFPPWKPSLTDLGQFIESQGVSILWLGAALFHQMAENHLHHLRHVRRLFTGGDVVSVPHAEKTLRTLKNCRLVNGYGPTENTTFSCCHPILTIPANGQSIPIGKPVAGTECHVLDEMLRPVPAGEAGELYVGGDGLAAGYLRNPQLTAEKFIPHPFSQVPRARLYRTGDRVRLLPDGNLEFLGRMDRQVKILGYRVEPSEIEAILRQHPAIRETSVMVQRTIAGEERLIAAIAVKDEMGVATADLRAFARCSLPQHMIPSDFVFLDKLPLNANGKIDQEALATQCTVQVRTRLMEDKSPTAERLAKIWSDVLGRPNITAADNFFELGGNSLRAAHLLARIQKEFRTQLSMNTFLEHPTIGGLARFLDEKPSALAPPLCLCRTGGPKPGLFCLPGQGGEMGAYLSTVEHYSGARPVYGLQSPALLGLEEGATIEEMAATHVNTIRALQPSGPYHLFGYCFGGLLAFETARQLHAQNAGVGLVGVLQFDVHDMPFAPFKALRIRAILRFLKNLFPALAECFEIGKSERNLAFIKVLSRLLAMPDDSGSAYSSGTAERRLYELHEVAWRKYVPKAFPGLVTLLRPKRLPIFHPDPNLGWGMVKGQRLEVRIVPGVGIHGESLRSGNEEGTARVVEKAIEERDLEPTV